MPDTVPSTPDSDAITPKLIATLREFCIRYRYQYPDRVHNAIYLLDHSHAEEHGEPYTPANYYPAYNGVISPEISHVLENELNTTIESVQVTPNRSKPKYVCHYLESTTDDLIDPDYITAHAETIEQLSMDELISKTRNTAGYEHTPDYTQITITDHL